MNIEIIRSKRKTAAIEITKDMRILLKVPLKYPEQEISSLLLRHKKWIEKTLEKIQNKIEKYPEPSQEQIRELQRTAREIIPEKVRYYSKLMGLVPTGVKITSARTRFGSCSGKNSLCFSWRLMRYPENCIDYVVVHELAHIKHHNHGKEFYSLVESVMPDYRERAKILKS